MSEEAKNAPAPLDARSIAKPGLDLLCADFPELAAEVREILGQKEPPGSECDPTRELTTETAPTAIAGQGPRRAEVGDQVPRRIGRYAVTALVGEGGQSLVYRAVHPLLASEVIVKVCNHAAAGGVNAPSALADEGRLLAELKHPHIAQVYDLDLHEGRPFLVMEYVRGRNLKQFASDAPLDPRLAARLAAQAARGVGAAHRAGVVHLDIKPHNIVVDDSGQVKVIDFGIARRRGAMYEESSERTAGTPMYFAPEQAQGRADLLDSRTDVFGLGCVLYYLLCGKHAYGAVPRADLMQALSTGAFDRAALGKAAVPERLKSICLKAMSVDRAARYPDGDATAAELERFLQPARRRRLAVVGAACVLAACSGLLWNALRAPPRQPGPPHAGPPNVAIELPIRTEVLRGDGWVTLARAGPLLDGDKIRIECDVPPGLCASLLLLDPQGELTELSRLDADTPQRTLRHPGEGQAVPLTPPSGTEVLLVLTRRGGPVEPNWLKAHWPAPGGWPALAPGSVVFLADGQARVMTDSRGLGAPVAAGDPADEVRARMAALRRALADQVQDVRAVAFSHAATAH